ncbi:MAG: ABC transporter permease, partial [Dehalococcoidia bacterium]
GHTEAAMAALEDLLAGTPYSATAHKQDGIDAARFFGSLFVSFFVVLGLFSIASGILLIFLIFIMLAAERQPEMGMARAVGAKRRQIVESFLAEGMGYDLGSALVGMVAGMGATAAMVAILRAFLGDDLGVSLDLSFTVRSLVISVCLGLLATFIVIFTASWRASRLNIVAAIRDLPGAGAVNPEDATALGYLRALLNGMVMLAAPLGVVLLLLGGPARFLLAPPTLLVGAVSPWLYYLRGTDFSQPAVGRTGEPMPRWPWIAGAVLLVFGIGAVILLGYAMAAVITRAVLLVFGIGAVILLGYAIAAVITRIVRDRRPDSVPLWLLVVGALVPPLGFFLAALQGPRARIAWAAGLGVALGVGGVLLVAYGVDAGLQFPFALGVSLLCLCVATTMQYFHVAERAAFTISSLVLLAFWYLAPSGLLDGLTGELSGNIEMFFLSGFAMVAAGTFIVVYNADIILPAVGAAGARLGRIVPALKTGIAYPLSSRFRTGMTIAMIGLITFALVVNASLNANFIRLFINEDTKGGWDVGAWVNANNPIADIRSAIAGIPQANQVRDVGEIRAAYPFEAEVENRDGHGEKDGVAPDYLRYQVLGADPGFIDGQNIKLKARAAGFEDDDDVWTRLKADPSAALIPAAITTAPEGFGGNPETEDLLRLDPVRDGFEPFSLKLRAPDGTVTEVTVIGQMKESADPFWGGIIVRKDTLLAAFPESRGQQFFFRLDHGADADAAAREIERVLVQASVDSLQGILDDQARMSNGFMLIFQGFIGLGLIVGIAALAVIAFRSVVERRQQIGMLRAIGYQRGMVALSFMFESGFTAASGILLGVSLGLSLAWVLFTTGALEESTKGNGFTIPWLELAVVMGTAFGASLLMTVLPARQASGVPVAEALRYE